MKQLSPAVLDQPVDEVLRPAGLEVVQVGPPNLQERASLVRLTISFHDDSLSAAQKPQIVRPFASTPACGRG
jgi:hypothetical protein